MRREQINRFSGTLLIVLSLAALLTVLSGYFQAPQPDEGSAAHIFQLAIAALVPAIFIFLMTAEWDGAARTVAPLAISFVLLALAFGALFYLEHRFLC